MKRLLELLAKAPTRQRQKLLDAAAEIRLSPDAVELTFMARPLLQATLPHSDPGSAPVYRRTSGAHTMLLQSGYDESGKLIGLPYGIIPRLLLFWVITEAVRTKSPYLQLGRSLAEFMRDLGLDPAHGGERSDAHRLQEQARRLFSAGIQVFHTSSPTGGLVRQRSSGLRPLTKDSQFWWDPKDPQAPVLGGSWVELSPDFYEAIISAPVPLDVRVLKGLRRSPLALDLYALVSYRSFVCSRKEEEHFYPWADLYLQLGAGYADLDNFRRKCLAALKKISQVMPNLRYRRERKGFTVLPSSRPAIEPARTAEKETFPR